MNLIAATKVAQQAARVAGALMRKNLHSAKKANEIAAHDIKLELDVRCQQLIERRLAKAFPDVAVLGEEGVSGSKEAAARWVIDPIDGTVNYAYGIPHACVCIALQVRSKAKSARVDGGYATVVGVTYDPFMDEMWSARAGDVARLNGRPIRVSNRKRLSDSILVTGFGKDPKLSNESYVTFGKFVKHCRKVRIMGSAGLALTYVACGRFDGYVERVAGLWDIAAGGFIVERAGGVFWRERTGNGEDYRMIVTNGRIQKELKTIVKQ